MKYIENAELSALSRQLTHEGPECAVQARIEAYSCKNIKRDKKLFKALEHAYADEQSNSPPLPVGFDINEAEMTPFGPIDKSASRKTLYLLIATLNVAFPDHEFSDVRPGHFNKEESGASVLNALSTTLVSPHRAGDQGAPRTYSSYPPTSSDFFPSSIPTSSSSSPISYTYNRAPSPYAPLPIMSGTHPTLYRLIDDVIGLNQCEVFSYVPDIDSDPHANDDSEDSGSESDGDDSGNTDDDEATFEFDDYDIDEARNGVKAGRYRNSPPVPPSPIRGIKQHPIYPRSSADAMRLPSPTYMPSKRRGGLLWSSHWFFLNRKLNRILFISVWARSKGMNRSWSEDSEDAFAYEVSSKERFLGWEGGVGAGARAMGLRI